MRDTTLSTSPDPISIISDFSPVKRQMTRSPLRPIRGNSTSPRKSVALDAQDADGRSPWRIKVTVEAEPFEGSRSSINRQLLHSDKSITVPVKDKDDSHSARPQRRTRKPSIGPSESPIPDRIRSTQPRRRPTPARNTQNAPQAIAPIQMSSTVVPRRRTRRFVNASTADNTAPSENSTKCMGPGHDSHEPQNHHTGKLGRLVDSDYPHFPDDEPQHDDDFGTEAPGDATTFENEEFSMISVESLNSHHSHHSNSPNVTDHTYPEHPQARVNTSISYMPSSPPILRYSTITPQITQTPQQPPGPPQSMPHHPSVLTPLRESVLRSGRVLQDIVRSPENERSSAHRSVGSAGLSSGFCADRDSLLREPLRRSMGVGGNLRQGEFATSNANDKSDSLGIHYPNINRSCIDHRLPTPEDCDHEKSASTVSSGPPIYPKISEELLHYSPKNSKKAFALIGRTPDTPFQQTFPMMKVQSPKHANSVISISSEMSENLDIEELDEDEEGPIIQSILSEASGISQHTDVNRFAPSEVADDIWQEQATRGESESVNDLTSQYDTGSSHGRLVAPRRSKLPRTWRRASGSHFHNSDSPRPEMAQQRQVSASNSSGQSEGVVTPPSTGSEDEPDAEDDAERESREPEYELAQPHSLEQEEGQVSCSLSTAVTADVDDTGVFWQSNLPKVLGQRQKQTRDYSVISELQPISSPVHQPREDDTDSAMSNGNEDIRKQLSQATKQRSPYPHKTSPAFKSALRKTALRSNEPRSSPISKDTNTTASLANISEDEMGDADQSLVSDQGEDGTEVTYEDVDEPEEITEQTFDESTAGDIRQLRAEMAAHNQRQSPSVHDSVIHDESLRPESSWLESTNLHASRSYVEDLNLASPTKIAVKFNDSSALERSLREHTRQCPLVSNINTSILSPQKKKYSSLFQDDAPLGAHDVSESALNDNSSISTKPSQPRSGLMSKMANSFWSAVGSSAPPTPKPAVVLDPSSPAEESSLTSVQSFLPVVRASTSVPGAPTITDLTLRLRRKYGLLNPSHPFTLAHARTLHRLYLSTVQHPNRTLVPFSAPVPPATAHLLSLPSKPNKTHVHVAACFMSLLVPNAERERLEAQGGWGDERATKDRGWDARGRHGTWFAFTGDGKDDKAARAMRGDIELAYVSEVLMEIVKKEALIAKK
ncbi:hypothetical protein K461DRAFT_281627 [Myriangium duriaei CBS 260.36]|uniref:Uncharacterized protein n=1 Tax=Myriangium duriaei CBS 260.36 TaxID=1168546 RepID=A0A9P4IVK7_9PEZI|nr:hypothetical protein K461DRAFT_281627 [Myriangium duriaei CBS 260.36]